MNYKLIVSYGVNSKFLPKAHLSVDGKSALCITKLYGQTEVIGNIDADYISQWENINMMGSRKNPVVFCIRCLRLAAEAKDGS